MALSIAERRAARIVLVDDQALLRAGMRAMLDADPDFEVVGEATDGADVVRLVADRRADVVVMALDLPGVGGIAATRALTAARSTTRVLLLTDHDDADAELRALGAGAAGFIPRDASHQDLIDHVRSAAAGAPVLPARITRRLVDTYVHHALRETELSERFADLTARESQILERLVRGRSNAAISGELFLSEATVKTHVTRILSKLGVSSRVQAVVLAYEAGFVRLGEAFADEPATALHAVG